MNADRRLIKLTGRQPRFNPHAGQPSLQQRAWELLRQSRTYAEFSYRLLEDPRLRDQPASRFTCWARKQGIALVIEED